MLAVEQFGGDQYLHQSYSPENNLHDPYTSNTMEASYDFNLTDHLSYSYYQPSTTHLEALCYNPYEISRSASTGSTRRSEHDVPPTLLSSESIASTTSSVVASPNSGYVHMDSCHENLYVEFPGQAMIFDSEVSAKQLGVELAFSEHDHKMTGDFVDPSELSQSRNSYYSPNQYNISDVFSQPQQSATLYSTAPSPASSHAFSPPVTQGNYNQASQRRMSISSQGSANSPRSSLSSDDENCKKGRCLECGRTFKDPKAHMLTHLEERPHGCPIASCEYNKKGFARKYDKNRHTLTHYKGTMVCGFCPGSGSPGEQSFNRADTFKRHLKTVHGVEQNPPNSRKRSPSTSTKKLSSYCPDATGKCSTCSGTFNNAQEFYEHLDDCVLNVVQREAPSEAHNARLLAQVEHDVEVQDTLERHMIKTEDDFNPLDEIDEDEDDEDGDDDDDEDSRHERLVNKAVKAAGGRVIIGGNVAKPSKSTKKGMTWSKGGVKLGKGRKRRKNYPPSWGLAADKMKMKKRVLCVYDGPNRLLKDDLMMHKEYEVRLRLPDSDHYVTDLDVEILKRANAYHDASPAEKAEWFPQ